VDATHSGSAHLALGSTGATAAAGNHTHSAPAADTLSAVLTAGNTTGERTIVMPSGTLDGRTATSGIVAQAAAVGGGQGAQFLATAGNSGTGGGATLAGGSGTAATGASVEALGAATGANAAGGDLTLLPGAGAGTGRRGLILTGPNTLPTADPGVANALWKSSGAVVVSGYTPGGGGASAMGWIAGLYYPSLGVAPSTAVLTLNRAVASPIYIPGAYSINALAMVVAGGVASASGRVGLYADNGGRPGALVATTAGGHDWSGAGFGEYSITPVALGPGWFWVVLVGQVAAPNVMVFTQSSTSWAAVGTPNGSSISMPLGFGLDSITGAFPNPWGTPSVWYETRAPAVWLRRA
jgi:hypothetical protein